MRHWTTKTWSASTACHICPQRISTAGPICPQRIWTHQLRWPRLTGTRTWTRSWPRPTRIQCRTCTPHHIYHGGEGTRVHGTTSGHRRRILCAAAPGTASPDPPYSNLMKRYANWNAFYSCGFNVADGHTSQTCPQHLRKPDHDCYFTQQNAQQYVDTGYGCSTKSRLKTVFPQM
jgi:hypothetical protein